MSVTYIYPPIDANPADLYAGFQAYMQENIPGWVPYSGKLDDWLGRVFSGIAAQLMEITSDVATSIFRYFGAFIVNVPPIAASPAVGAITITVQDTVGYTIPAFTQMSFADATGTLQGFETVTDTVIAPASSTALNVFVQAMTPGAAGNGCTGSGDLDQSTPLTFITALTLNAATTSGTDDEDDTVYLNRLTALFSTLTPSPITVNEFTTIALTQPAVGRAVTLGGFNPANASQNGNTHTTTTIDNLTDTSLIAVGSSVSGSGVPGGAFVKSITSGTAIVISAATSSSLTGTAITFGGSLKQGGFVTSWVTDLSGIALSSPQMAVVAAAIQAECLTNVVYSVLAPNYTTVNVTSSVLAWPGQDTTVVQTAINAALNAYLSSASFGQSLNGTSLTTGVTNSLWLNDNAIRLAAIEQVIMNVVGVHDVTALTINSSGANLSLGGIVPLPTPGTMTTTVTNG